MPSIVGVIAGLERELIAPGPASPTKHERREVVTRLDRSAIKQCQRKFSINEARAMGTSPVGTQQEHPLVRGVFGIEIVETPPRRRQPDE